MKVSVCPKRHLSSAENSTNTYHTLLEKNDYSTSTQLSEMFHHQRGRNWLLNRTKYQEFHVHYVVRSFHTGASLYLLRQCVWEYVPVSFLCLCCRWIGRCQCFVYFSTYQWNKKNLNETFGKFLKSSLFTLLSLAVYYVIYLLSGDHGSRCNKR